LLWLGRFILFYFTLGVIYFYQQIHWTYVARPFLPYRLPNPPSSNPFEIYESLYKEWVDRDWFGRSIQQARIRIAKGIIANAEQLAIEQQSKLKVICERIDPLFFYPLVYRINIDTIEMDRRIISGSGLLGSEEFLIADLREAEFDLLFADYNEDSDFVRLAEGVTTPEETMAILEGRCHDEPLV
jgi:hypothetical protein